MNEYFEQWLDARITVPGMLACGITSVNMLDSGIGAVDATAFCRSSDPGFSTHQMAQVLRLLQDTPFAPETEPSALKWRTWVFGNGKIRATIRPDGLLFAAAVLLNSNADQLLDPLTEEFLTLKTAEQLVPQ
ncbi:MAG TPA: hypothetical protein VMF08_10345 [Candidatus Sulfotelmatobacter sp.]|nr:hypothetical protein [Candidatus Sulfotelmatobacter sp.]